MPVRQSLHFGRPALAPSPPRPAAGPGPSEPSSHGPLDRCCSPRPGEPVLPRRDRGRRPPLVHEALALVGRPQPPLSKGRRTVPRPPDPRPVAVDSAPGPGGRSAHKDRYRRYRDRYQPRQGLGGRAHEGPADTGLPHRSVPIPSPSRAPLAVGHRPHDGQVPAGSVNRLLIGRGRLFLTTSILAMALSWSGQRTRTRARRRR